MRENNSLGDKFAGFTSEPNPEVWENIERSLDEKPRRRVFAWIFLVAGAFAGIILWNFQGEVAPKNTKYVSKENTMAKPAAQSASPSKASAENKIAQNELLPGKFQSGSGQSLINKRILKASWAVPLQPNLSSLNQMEEPNPTKGSTTELKASENVINNSTVNTHIDAPKDELLSENTLKENASKQDSLDRSILPDSSVLSQQNTAVKIEKPQPRICRWQLQAQIGAFGSRKEEMVVVPSPYDPYFEGTGNVVSGGYLPITLGNPNVIKPYRSILANYSVLASYNPISRWRLTTGFSYLRYYIYTLDDHTLRSGAHYIQIPVIADFKLLNKPKWEWSLGTGASVGYVFEKKSASQFSSWRSDFIAQTSLRYALTQRMLLQVQPQARFVFWDKEMGKVNKLSPWYWGGNVGVIWCF